jgi:UDPglucose 6-dehydrogenase
MADDKGVDAQVLKSVQLRNYRQKQRLFQMIEHHFGTVNGKRIAVWGLAFKPGTDDIREAPAVELIKSLLAAGAVVTVHDPVANENVAKVFGDKLVYFANSMNALIDADGLAIVTEWKSFANPDFQHMRDVMRGRVIFDGRNIFTPQQVAHEGFMYYGIGQR